MHDLMGGYLGTRGKLAIHHLLNSTPNRVTHYIEPSQGRRVIRMFQQYTLGQNGIQ